jgi:hypothetical protein
MVWKLVSLLARIQWLMIALNPLILLYPCRDVPFLFSFQQMGKYSCKRKSPKDILRKVFSSKVFPDLSLAAFISNGIEVYFLFFLYIFIVFFIIWIDWTPGHLCFFSKISSFAMLEFETFSYLSSRGCRLQRAVGTQACRRESRQNKNFLIQIHRIFFRAKTKTSFFYFKVLYCILYI